MEDARLTGWQRSVILGLDRGILALSRNWPLWLNVFWAIYVASAIAAPFLMAGGQPEEAGWIYRAHRLNCHQLAHRSFFLFGPQATYSLEEIAAQTPIRTLEDLQDFVGNDATGYKLAFCQRDAAIYGSILAVGLAFAWLRGRARALPWPVYLLFVLPIAFDALTQFAGLREGSWIWRVATGTLFGASTVWLAYPLLDRALQDSGRQAQRQLDRASGQAIAHQPKG